MEKREIRTVGGRRYNLDTAKKIGTSADATLYKKKNGEFFLHRTGENKIKSLSYYDAGKWAEENLNEEEYAAAFEYSEKSQQVVYSLPQYAIEKLRTMAGDRKTSASQILTEMIMNTIYLPESHSRLLTTREAANYVGLGIQSFRKWADEIGATRYIGPKSVRFDKEVIDKAIDQLK